MSLHFTLKHILRGEEMDDCCLGVSALCFHPGSVTVLKKLHFTVLPSLSLADIVEAVDDDVDVNDKVQAHNALVYYAFAFQPFWFICVFTLFKFIQGL